MKFTLKELQEENQAKISPLNEGIPEKLAIKSELNKCNKHDIIQKQCTKLGIHRTKMKRWRDNYGRVDMRTPFISDADIDNLEIMYDDARNAFHNTPCTCFPKR